MSIDETLMCSFQILKPADKKKTVGAGFGYGGVGGAGGAGAAQNRPGMDNQGRWIWRRVHQAAGWGADEQRTPDKENPSCNSFQSHRR